MSVAVASERKPLPEGWRWVRTADIGDVKLGRQRSPKDQYGDYMRPYLRVANVFEDRIDLSDLLSMNFTPDEFETYRLRYGDILLNEGQSAKLVGRPAMYRGELPNGCFQNTLIRFRPSQIVLPEFALIVFRSYFHLGRFAQIAKRTVNIAHLGAERLSAMEFPLPPVPEQRRIVATLTEQMAAVDKARGALKAQLEAARALMSAYLRSAFQGVVPLDVGADHRRPPDGWRWTRLADVARLESVDFGAKRPSRAVESGHQARRKPATACG